MLIMAPMGPGTYGSQMGRPPKKKKPMARGIKGESPVRVTKTVKKKGLNVMKSKNKGDIVYVQKVDKLGRVRVAAVKVPRF